VSIDSEPYENQNTRREEEAVGDAFETASSDAGNVREGGKETDEDELPEYILPDSVRSLTSEMAQPSRMTDDSVSFCYPM
jgi:hypothetical protein